MSGNTRQLKTAHVARRFTFDEWGGTETVVWHTVRQLIARGVGADILATCALSSPGEEVREGVKIRRFDYSYPYFPMPEKTRLELDKKGGNPFSPKLFKTLENGGYDLIHIHSGGRMAVMCALMARRLGIPCVMSLHGGCAVVPREEVRRMMAPTRGKFNYGGIIDRLRGLRRDATAEADAVICISRGEERSLRERLPGHRIVYLPNGVDCGRFQAPAAKSPRAEWGIPGDRRLILCISRIDYQKNQKLLLRLAAADPESHLLLIGPVTAPWYHRELLEEANVLGVAGRLTVIPGLPPDDPRLPAILYDADVFVLPSLHEPFGIAALEAWAAGVPVIASEVGGLRDFIVHERNGLLFPSGSGEALLAEYRRLMNDPGLREKLVEGAAADVRAYSWESITGRLLELYEELCRERD